MKEKKIMLTSIDEAKRFVAEAPSVTLIFDVTFYNLFYD